MVLKGLLGDLGPGADFLASCLEVSHLSLADKRGRLMSGSNPGPYRCHWAF